MTEFWRQCEGQVIADTFLLQRCLSGDDAGRAVFLTEYGSPQARKAAIKIVLGDAPETEEHLRRWSAVAKLSHRHLLEIFSMGRSQLGDAPLAYLVMEYADESLSQVIPVRALTADEAHEMLKPAISALGYIHGQQFVHGHLKPANIMATGDCLKISSAEIFPMGEHRPAPADGYAPPEKTLSKAGDVWSLGVTLVEALTQRLPRKNLDGSGDAIWSDTPPEPLADIVRQCLRSDPGARPALTEIADRLRPPKRPRLQWMYPLAASAGLVIAAVLIVPHFLSDPQTSSQPAIAPPPLTAPAVTPARAKPQARSSRTSDEIIRQALPDVPAKASRTIQGKVKVSVRVQVAPSGNVADVELNARGPSSYFAQLALQAARRWKFAPTNTPREWILLFEFSRTGTRVVPVPGKR